MKLRINEVLDYFDGPQIMDCVDGGGQGFIVLMLADKAEAHYIAVPVGRDRLRAYKHGTIDLRTLMTESKTWKLANDASSGLEVAFEREGEIPEDYLPSAGYHHSKSISQPPGPLERRR